LAALRNRLINRVFKAEMHGEVEDGSPRDARSYMAVVRMRAPIGLICLRIRAIAVAEYRACEP
jgi:hypothetical protein